MNADIERVAEIDEAELLVRMIEAAMGRKRPPGMTALEALSHFREHGDISEKVFDSLRQMAEAAMSYVDECVDTARPIS